MAVVGFNEAVRDQKNVAGWRGKRVVRMEWKQRQRAGVGGVWAERRPCWDVAGC